MRRSRRKASLKSQWAKYFPISWRISWNNHYKPALSNSAKPYGTKVCFFILQGNLYFKLASALSNSAKPYGTKACFF
jgi:hypothetical protein